MDIITVMKEKEKIFKSKLRWNNKEKTVLKTTIPAKVVHMLQLDADSEIIYKINEIDVNTFQCEITFHADHLKHNDETQKDAPMEVDEARPKHTETKTTPKATSNNAGNKLDVKNFADIPIMDGKYTIKVTTPSRPKLRICGDTIKDEVNKTELGISVAKKSEDEVQAIIDDILSTEDADAKKLKALLNGYKSEQYRT